MTVDILFQSLPAKSFIFGIISTISLPIGALIGIWLKPGKRIVAAFMAFGAGALLSALTMELVVPSFENGCFYSLASGSIAGGLLFLFFNNLLNGSGAFLRKPATLMRHLLVRKKSGIKNAMGQMAKIDIFRSLPPSAINTLMPYIHPKLFDAGALVFKQGDTADSIFIIEKGEVSVSRDGSTLARLKDGDTFGEMALISGEPRNATVKTVTRVSAWQILKEDFERLIQTSPALLESVKALSEKRLHPSMDITTWRRQVERYANALSLPVTERDIREEAKAHGTSGAAFAIWLGLLLDGIPEAAVVGATMTGAAVSWALIAGLFLSNLPEAMSSSCGMRQQNKSVSRILLMWTSIVLVSAVVALLGNLFIAGSPHGTLAVFEGLAAGAMMVVIAETMLPEAYEQGGAVVGFSTLLGFLSGLFIKSLG